MTALTDYQRLESPGIWRPAPAEQRRDVLVSIGDATLVIYDKADQPVAHWSLAALIRLNPGTRPALFAPGPDAPEELEVAEETMVDAIEKVRKTIEKRRPRQGRLRLVLLAGGLAAIVALGWFWLPDRVISHAVGVVPAAKRMELGDRILAHIRRVAGRPCETVLGRRALNRLQARLLPDHSGRLVVLPGGVAQSTHLPGGLILLGRELVEDHDSPDVLAGYILAEGLRSAGTDPVETLLRQAGPMDALKLLTTGDLPETSLAAYAEAVLTDAPAPVGDQALLAAFAEARVASTPYAYARDISGETTLTLIEADPGSAEPVLPDADWVGLQGICGE